ALLQPERSQASAALPRVAWQKRARQVIPRAPAETRSQSVAKECRPESVGAKLRHRQQHPVARSPPLLFKSRTIPLQQFSFRWVVNHHEFLLRIQAGDDHVVQCRVICGLGGNDQGTSFLQVLMQSLPSAGEGKGAETLLLQIALEVRCVNAVR